MKMAMQSPESLKNNLLRLPCHFSWKCLQNGNVGRTVEMNIDNLEEHIHEAIQGTEVKSYNLMGFYKTQQEHFEEARVNFQDALKYSKTEDERIVSLGCLAWLTSEESCSDSSSDVVELINQVQNILHGRKPEGIPEVMADKAFAIASSGFTEEGFKEALDSIDKALEKRSDDVMYKFTKATLLLQCYHKTHKSSKTKDDTSAQKIKKLWEEIIASLKTNSKNLVLHGQALVQYAMFLNKLNFDFGATGKPYIEKAEDIARSHQATAVMRNVAIFYIRTAGKYCSGLNKAEAILEEILESNPDDYKGITSLAHCLFKKYKLKPLDVIFDKAEEYFRKAWDFNKKYSNAALDLIRLYQMKYDKTNNIGALVNAEKIFQELNYEAGKENLEKAMIYTAFGCFLKGYGCQLAFYHQSCSYDQVASERSPKIGEALEEIRLYTQDKQDVHLLQAEQIFRHLYNSLEELRGPVKALFHKKYAAFLDNYSDDLAFYYLTESLKHNSHQGFAYEPLEQLARGKIASPDWKEQMKGRRTLVWITELQQHQEHTES